MAKKNFITYTVGMVIDLILIIIVSDINPTLNIFNYRGRATPREYWLFLVFWVTLIPLFLSAFTPISFLIFLASIVMLHSLAVRRLHDIGMSGYWILLTHYFWLFLQAVGGGFLALSMDIPNEESQGIAFGFGGLFMVISLIGFSVLQIWLFAKWGDKFENKHGDRPDDKISSRVASIKEYGLSLLRHLKPEQLTLNQ